jgi:aspartate racemase
MPHKHKNKALDFHQQARYSATMQHNPTQAFKRVGILGGMGPAATVDLIQKIIALTPAHIDQEHIPLVVWHIPQVPPRTAAIQDASHDSPLASLLQGAISLKMIGAQAIAIACNTAHHWAGDIENLSEIPLLHIADIALDSLANFRPPFARAMLLATQGTITAGFYAQKAATRNLALVQPDTDLQICVDAAIDLAKAGQIEEAQGALIPHLNQLRCNGVDVFVLGCTELPLILKNTELESYAFDPTIALARSIVEFSLGCTFPQS